MSSTYHRRRACPLITGTLAALALCAGPAGASTLLITGAGDGHGVGMSQDGALGFARHGYSYEAILAHYYAGTTLGQAPAQLRHQMRGATRDRGVPIHKHRLFAREEQQRVIAVWQLD